MRPTILLLLCIFVLTSCVSKMLGKHYLTKTSDISSEIVLHGIEMECFKFENARWPNSFGEMILYQPKVLPCLGLDINKGNLWKKYPTALISEIDDKNALIVINEKIENGKLLPLAQPLHINYNIEYQRHFQRSEQHPPN